MNCETARIAWSATLDGEPPNADLGLVERHIDECADCRAWLDTAHELTRRARLSVARAPVRPEPSALDRIYGAWEDRMTERRVHPARWALLAVAIVQAAFAVHMVLFGRVDAIRDTGAMDMALAVGFLMVAWRPARAVAIAGVVGTAAMLLVLMATLDLIHGTTTLVAESPHAIVFVGWLLVRRIGRMTPPTAASNDRMSLPSAWAAVRQVLSGAKAEFPTHPGSPLEQVRVTLEHETQATAGFGAPLPRDEAEPRRAAGGSA
jgi:predicted anti-sigma-YlaC factor YlaD